MPADATEVAVAATNRRPTMFKIIDWGHLFIVTEDNRAWDKRRHKKDFVIRSKDYQFYIAPLLGRHAPA